MHSAVAASLGVLVLIAGKMASFESTSPSFAALDELPRNLDGCGRGEWLAPWDAEGGSSDFFERATYVCPEGAVHLILAQYLKQAKGREAVTEVDRSIPKDMRLQIARSGSLRVGGLNVKVRTADDVTLSLWYAVGDEAHRDKLNTKIAELQRAVLFDHAPTAFFVVAVEGQARDQRALERSAQALWSWYQGQIGKREWSR